MSRFGIEIRNLAGMLVYSTDSSTFSVVYRRDTKPGDTFSVTIPYLVGKETICQFIYAGLPAVDQGAKAPTVSVDPQTGTIALSDGGNFPAQLVVLAR